MAESHTVAGVGYENRHHALPTAGGRLPLPPGVHRALHGDGGWGPRHRADEYEGSMISWSGAARFRNTPRLSVVQGVLDVSGIARWSTYC